MYHHPADSCLIVHDHDCTKYFVGGTAMKVWSGSQCRQNCVYQLAEPRTSYADAFCSPCATDMDYCRCILFSAKLVSVSTFRVFQLPRMVSKLNPKHHHANTFMRKRYHLFTLQLSVQSLKQWHYSATTDPWGRRVNGVLAQLDGFET